MRHGLARPWPAVVSVAALLTLLGCSGGSGANGGGGQAVAEASPGGGSRSPAAAVKYESPQSVFDASKSALKNKNYETFVATLTPDTLELLAGGLVMTPRMLQSQAAAESRLGDEEKKKVDADVQRLVEVLARHGVSQEQLDNAPPPGDDPVATMKALAALVQDKPALVAEMFGLMDSLYGGEAESPADAFDGELRGLEVDGDNAKGTVVSTQEGRERPDPIEFQNIDGGWLIRLPMAVE